MKVKKGILFATAAGLLLGGVAAFAARDVLPPEQVFRYSVDALGDDLVVKWSVKPGHYLYRARLGFESLTPGVELGEPIFPQGEPHEDEFFGEQEIYRDEFRVVIPFTRSAAVEQLGLQLRLQGCADWGLCYPPLKWKADVSLPAPTAAPAAGGKLTDLLGSAPGSNREFLHPDEAFRFHAEFTDPFTLKAEWIIAEGYYLYRDKLGLSSNSELIALTSPELPAGKTKYDEYFGESQVFYEVVTARVPFSRASPVGDTIELEARYQGCAEDGICYPPITKTISLDLPAATTADAPRGPTGDSVPLSDQAKMASLIHDGNLALVLASFFGFGLLLAFTPCVLPMVPILSGIIAGQGDSVTTRRAFMLSLTYVLGMALTYTIAGALFAVAGQQAQAFFQKPWILIVFSGLFIALALAMFGFYNIQIPASLQSRLAAVSNRQKAGTFAGTALMGALSALIVSACVAPPLVAALAVIGQSGDVTRGALALFALSMGMGTPLLVVGASAGKLLPKAGPWMETIKAVFGVMFLGVAVWMLGRILPGSATLALWAVVAFVGGYYLGGFRIFKPSPGLPRVVTAVGLVAILYGALALVGAAAGGMDPLRPLHGTALVGGGTDEELHFKRIKTLSDLELELTAARAANRPAMLDLYADWCVSCKEMEKYTFTDPDVHAAVGDAVLLQADVTAYDSEDQALLKHFGIFGPPTIAFFVDGEERTEYRVVGFMPAERFHSHVADAFSGQ